MAVMPKLAVAVLAGLHIASARLSEGEGRESIEFDCKAGVERMETGWSTEKKTYCCTHSQIGCQSSGSTHSYAVSYDHPSDVFHDGYDHGHGYHHDNHGYHHDHDYHGYGYHHDEMGEYPYGGSLSHAAADLEGGWSQFQSVLGHWSHDVGSSMGRLSHGLHHAGEAASHMGHRGHYDDMYGDGYGHGYHHGYDGFGGMHHGYDGFSHGYGGDWGHQYGGDWGQHYRSSYAPITIPAMPQPNQVVTTQAATTASPAYLTAVPAAAVPAR